MRPIDGKGPALAPRAATVGRSLSAETRPVDAAAAVPGRLGGTGHRRKAIFIVAPDGQAGGGMGQVKDYILRAGDDARGRHVFVPVVTRDMRGVVHSLWLLLGGILTIWRHALVGRAALVHVHMGDNGSAARKGLIVMAARLAGIPTLLHLHAVSLDALYARSGPLARWALRRPFRAASAVIVLGERFRAWVVDEMGVDPERVDILNNGVASRAPAGPIVRARQAGPVRMLFLGNLLERKGVSDLIAALAMVPAAAGAWRITFAGGGDIDHYRALAAREGIADRADFVGWVDREGALDLLERVDLLVLPSYAEGLPLVILEALGAGVPVLCTPVGSIAEVLENGTHALFCPPGDRAALAAALGRLVAEPSLRAHLATGGKALFDRRFSLSAFQNALFEIYHRRCGVRFVPVAASMAREDAGLP
jgi:glycosyltransferase involved in cell wall biosynthesis